MVYYLFTAFVFRSKFEYHYDLYLWVKNGNISEGKSVIQS